MAYLPAHRLKLYRNFKAIDTADYHGIVRYYERFEDAIGSLDTEEYFDCTLAYTTALFEIGNYGQHVVMCDHLLEVVIMQNIESWGGEDIYAHLLFRKSAALYQLREFARSEHVLRELLKLHPWNRAAMRLLRACLLRQKPAWLIRVRATAIALTFLAAAAIAVELFVVRPFFLDYYESSMVVHNVLLASAVLLIAGGECSLYWQCDRNVCHFARSMRARKKQSG